MHEYFRKILSSFWHSRGKRECFKATKNVEEVRLSLRFYRGRHTYAQEFENRGLLFVLNCTLLTRNGVSTRPRAIRNTEAVIILICKRHHIRKNLELQKFFFETFITDNVKIVQEYNQRSSPCQLILELT